ncbi:acyltransferase [Methylobacterium sp. E-046]|nr:acyltransferase [Methylobacterium sp. E-046]
MNHFASYSSNNIAVTKGENRAYGFLWEFYNVGAVGVEIFFVISGLVIATSVPTGSGFSAAKGFMRRRAQRIIPTLWMSSSVSFLALCSIQQDWISLLDAFIKSSLLLPLGPYVDGVVWSLIVEVFFYTLVALTILRSSKNRLETLAAAIAIFSVTYNLILFSFTVGLFDYNNDIALSVLHRFPFKLFLLRYGVFFALGIYISVLKRKRCIKIAVLALTCSIFCVAEIISSSELEAEKTLLTVFVWLTCVAVIIVTLLSKATPSVISRLRLSKPIRFLGDLSYPLYLNHYTLGIVLTYHLRYTNSSLLKFEFVICVVVATSAIILAAENYMRHRLFGKQRKFVGYAVSKPLASFEPPIPTQEVPLTVPIPYR